MSPPGRTDCRQRVVIGTMLLAVTTWASQAAAAQAESPGRLPFTTARAVLAEKGKPLLPVVVAENAPDDVRQAAEELAAMLSRIVGSGFAVETGNGSRGLAVGRVRDFPGLKMELPGSAADPTRREDYLLQSHAGGVVLAGHTAQGVTHAVWDLLHRLGFRQYFPGAAWEVVPQHTSLALEVSVLEHPDYLARRIWYGFGPWDYAHEPYRRWCERNRATSGIELSTGHAYDGIIARNRAVFDEHPEYLGLVDGERKSTKLCISNAGLRALVVRDALARMAVEPTPDSISVDPSDGLGWCECEECRQLGSVSDRAVTLANTVAEAVSAKYPGRLVGMYAYAGHSPPPQIDVHPNVVISVATAFIKGGFTVDELIEGWRERKATLGIREYYSVNTWDRDLPGRSRGSRLEYLARTIPHFHRSGARFLSAESSDNWGPNGLGYWLAARMLWDVEEANRLEELQEDFLRNAFGPAAGPMREFYRRIDGSRRPLLSEDLIGRLYRQLKTARGLASERPDVLARLNELVLYVRYVELYLGYTTASGVERQGEFEQLIRHAWQMRQTMLVHTKALYRDLHRRDKTVSIPEGATWNIPADSNPWKTEAVFTRADVEKMLAWGIASNPLLQFEAVEFSRELVSAAPLKLPEVPKTGSMGLYSRNIRNYWTWIDSPPATLELKATAGLIYRNLGPSKFALYPVLEPESKAVARAEVPPDREEHAVRLTSAIEGLARVEVADGSQGTRITWPEGWHRTVESSISEPAALYGRWTLYFYVPRGTQTVGGFADGRGELLDADGKSVYTFEGESGYFHVPVAAGQDGRLWRFSHCSGRRLLMTVPPFLARSGKELLLPAEVVERDSRR